MSTSLTPSSDPTNSLSSSQSNVTDLKMPLSTIEVDLQKALKDVCRMNNVSMKDIEKLLQSKRELFGFEDSVIVEPPQETNTPVSSVISDSANSLDVVTINKPNAFKKVKANRAPVRTTIPGLSGSPFPFGPPPPFKHFKGTLEDDSDEDLRIGEEDMLAPNGTKYTQVHQIYNYDTRSWEPRDPNDKASKEYEDREGVVFVVKRRVMSNSGEIPTFQVSESALASEIE
jgi:hypothetical protein